MKMCLIWNDRRSNENFSCWETRKKLVFDSFDSFSGKTFVKLSSWFSSLFRSSKSSFLELRICPKLATFPVLRSSLSFEDDLPYKALFSLKPFTVRVVCICGSTCSFIAVSMAVRLEYLLSSSARPFL